jgi:hypothetical protein
MPSTKSSIILLNEHPLKWPDGQQHTLIERRLSKNQWRKTFHQYADRLAAQLTKLKIVEAALSFNLSPTDKRDPGVALYFSKPESEDYSWQVALGIDSPIPTEKEINEAFKHKALKHHPDEVARGSGGDPKLWLVYSDHKRRALSSIKGEVSHEFCIAVDRCTEPRWNVEALRRLLIATATMDEYGNPGTLERTFRGFRVALPAKASEDAHASTSA